MGGRDWESTKAKVKKEVEVVAYDLFESKMQNLTYQPLKKSPGFDTKFTV